MNKPEANLRYASTVILKRGKTTPEIYMLKRSANASFMPNALVFPGGALDEHDHSLEWASMTNISRAQAHDALHVSDPSLAHSLMVAAARETFEEAGVLLVNTQEVDLSRHAELRAQLNAQTLNFLEVLRALDLKLDLNSMNFISRWQTPKVERKRFDAFFFMVNVPEGELGESADGHETRSGRWYTPIDVLEAHRRKEVQLAPPTLRAIETINAQSNADWSGLKSINTTPICPQFLPNQEFPTLTLPGDVDFHPPGTSINRFELINGYWTSTGVGF